MARDYREISNKTELLCSLSSMRCAAIYDIFAQICLHEFFKQAHNGLADLELLSQVLPEGVITLKQFVEQVGKLGDNALVQTKRNANRFLTRNMVKEAFRLTESYCRSTGQGSVLEKESWHHFARILVNSMSHNFRFEFRKYDKILLPVSYKDVEITKSMDGKPPRFQLQVLIQLVDEIMEFAKYRLS